MLLTVAIIGPAHALKGEVRLDVRTDNPDGRLVPGHTFPTDPSQAGPLTIDRVRYDGSRWFATFTQATDRTAAEALRGVRLLVDTDTDEDADDDGWYAHELIGLRAQCLDTNGDVITLGTVQDVEPGVAQDRLVVRTPDGTDVAVPFVEQLVPEIDLEAGSVTLDPPGGLFPSPHDVASSDEDPRAGTTGTTDGEA